MYLTRTGVGYSSTLKIFDSLERVEGSLRDPYLIDPESVGVFECIEIPFKIEEIHVEEVVKVKKKTITFFE